MYGCVSVFQTAYENQLHHERDMPEACEGDSVNFPGDAIGDAEDVPLSYVEDKWGYLSEEGIDNGNGCN